MLGQWLQGSTARAVVRYSALAAVLAILATIFGLASDNFWQTSTLTTIANRVPDLTLVAIGMTFILMIGRIDLSVGSVLALGSACIGTLMVEAQWSLWAAVPIGLVACAMCGLVSGSITVIAGIPSFIVTLGMLEVARGLTKVVTDSQVKFIGSAVESFGQPIHGVRVSAAFVMAGVLVIVGQLILSKTVFGRYCVAIGNNEQAAKLSGIRVRPIVISVFVINGLLCGLAAFAYTSRLSSADPNAAIGMELSAIAACVIGGTSLMGGRGGVINTFFGVLIISVLETGLNHLGVSDAKKQIVTGGVIVVAVLVDAIRDRWSR